MSQSNLPNPFLAARRAGGITVLLRPDDLKGLRPELREADAARLLERHGAAIAARMIGAGIEAALFIADNQGSDS